MFAFDPFDPLDPLDPLDAFDTCAELMFGPRGRPCDLCDLLAAAVWMRYNSLAFRALRVNGFVGESKTHRAKNLLSNQWPPALDVSRKNTAYCLGKRRKVHGSGSL